MAEKVKKKLRQIVSKDGIESDPKKIEKVHTWSTPENSDQLRSFLAFVSYNRRFIKDFSRIDKPLSELLTPHQIRKQNRKMKRNRNGEVTSKR